MQLLQKHKPTPVLKKKPKTVVLEKPNPLNLRSLNKAFSTTPSLRSLNSLIFEVSTFAARKNGATVVAGILNHIAAVDVIAGLGHPVRCYDTRESRVVSKLSSKLTAFALPKQPKHATFFLDDNEAIGSVSLLFFFQDIKLPSYSLVSGAILVGDEPTLREALKGHKFYPRARWRKLLAVEIQ